MTTQLTPDAIRAIVREEIAAANTPATTPAPQVTRPSMWHSIDVLLDVIARAAAIGVGIDYVGSVTPHSITLVLEEEAVAVAEMLALVLESRAPEYPIAVWSGDVRGVDVTVQCSRRKLPSDHPLYLDPHAAAVLA